MRWGVDSGPLKNTLLYASFINTAGVLAGCPPPMAYAIAYHETISGELNDAWNACSVVSNDGGHGLFQLTSSWPGGWQHPYTNALYAMENFIVPDALYWTRHFGFTGSVLVKCVAASFNTGLANALAGHKLGNVDLYTTDNYGARVEAIYQNLVNTGAP